MNCERIGKNALLITFDQGSVTPLQLNFDGIDTSPQMREFSRDAFERHTGPGGTWKSRSGILRNFGRLKTFLHAVPQLQEGFPDPKMTRRHLEQMSESSGRATLCVIRSVFKDAPQTPPALQMMLESMRVPRPKNVRKVKLTSEQFLYAQTESLNTIREAVKRIEKGWEQIDNPPNWPETGFFIERKLDGFLRRIAEAGDIEERSGKNTKGFLQTRTAEYALNMGPTERPAANLFARLYPLADEMAAVAIALSAICGWNISIVRQLKVNDVETTRTPNSQTTHTVTLRKPRRGTFDTWTETYIDDGPLSKGRLISLIIRLTAGVRRTFSSINDPRNELLAYIPLTMNNTSKHTTTTPLFTINELETRGFQNHLDNWLSARDKLAGTLPSDYRKYFVSRVHPQAHTTDQNLDYVRGVGLSTELISRLSNGIGKAVGIDDITILDKANITSDDLWRHTVTPENIEAVNSRRTDTGQSSCIDPEHKPDTGSPCDSGFLTCFTCKNAVILRRHLPSCVALRDHLHELSRTLAPGAWTQTHTNALASLNQILHPNKFFQSEVLSNAQQSVTPELEEKARATTENRWLV